MKYTLEQTLADQEALDTICADRPLETEEIFPGNAYYGADRVLKAYSGYHRPLKIVVPHGPPLDDRFVWLAEAVSPLPAVFYFCPHRQGAYEKWTKKVVLPSASPFLYLKELVKDQPQPPRKGTIFYPGHSTHQITAEMDYEGIAATLLGFEEDYQPVTVCLYWKDILLGRHELFRRRGLKVVSAGHLYDTYFFWRFYHLCSRHRYAASNTYSSALLYAVESGCSFFFSESFGFREVAAESVKEELKEAKEPEDRLAAIKALFAQPRPAATPEQLEMVDYYLGTAYLRSPAELRRQFLQAEKWDKTLFYVRHSDGRRKFFLPTYYRRKIDYLVYLAKNFKTALKDRLRGYGHRWPALSRWLGLQR